MNVFKQIYQIAIRECRYMWRNPIYGFCLVVFPLIVVAFFTTLMGEGVPTDMPCGVVDEDHTATTRALERRLDAFQTTKIVAYYDNVDEARDAIQKGDIYAFLYIPDGTTKKLVRGDQPKISFYYSSVVMVAGNMLFRDLKTISSLGSAAVGIQKLSAIGKTSREIQAFLQPIAIDLHMIENPWANYNVYLSTSMLPGILLIFTFLLTPYSLGTELKFNRSKEWMRMADNNVFVALTGKLLPQTLILLCVFYSYLFYVFGYLDFPHPGGLGRILLLGTLVVLACQSFGVFAFGLMPSLRMSMSICSLWSVVSFSVCGATFPLTSMDPPIQAMAQLFPLRHYYMIYQMNIFNGFPLSDAAFNWGCLVLFLVLPIFVLRNIKRAMLLYVYIP
ncbi:ABC transporter permease [Prevotella sp. AGR2160]|uniref:ABC transporter permease n=1 Tax=Prevotella sp. AGR2160 TaxID=1280674 RepID=UPI00041B84C7|nr:ABC transporter permease [Prevotella sp. AGR2160]